VQARISELQAQLDKLGGKGYGEPGHKQDAESLYPSIRELPILGVAYTDLYRQAKIQEAVFETLTQQYELAKVQEAKEIPSVKVLDAARLPEKKSFPPRVLITCLTGVLFLAAAMMGMYVQSKWDEKAPMILAGCLRTMYFKPCTPGHSFPIPMDRAAEVRCNVSFRDWPVASLGKAVPLPNQIRHRCVSVIEISLVGSTSNFRRKPELNLHPLHNILITEEFIPDCLSAIWH
jgi:hypothetical protein